MPKGIPANTYKGSAFLSISIWGNLVGKFEDKILTDLAWRHMPGHAEYSVKYHESLPG